ncbi:unnamed protein product [Meloidogyne enterolobii]|uniref:Uncharacterized protein n=1 Tax=Meloidogyne enterolobii TaxID=390850 RepID=A0ACB0XXT1_MELEN
MQTATTHQLILDALSSHILCFLSSFPFIFLSSNLSSLFTFLGPIPQSQKEPKPFTTTDPLFSKTPTGCARLYTYIQIC